jgi:hypothetical protein
MAYDASDKETKAALKAAVDEAVETAIAEATEGLKTKNTELLGKLKKAQKDATIDPADHAALQAELDETEAKLTTALKDAKTATKAADDAKKALEGESKVAHNLLVDNGLSDALIANGVKKASYLKAAKAMLAGQVILTADGENRIAKVGDKALADFVKEWAASDEGKAFVDAKVNSGGGADGGAEGGGGDTDLSKMSPEARLQAINKSEAAAEK